MRNFNLRRCARFILTALFVAAIGAANAQTTTLTTIVDENNGNTGSITLLNGTPGGAGISLREAIIAASNEPVGATITINIPAGNYAITLAGVEPVSGQPPRAWS